LETQNAAFDADKEVLEAFALTKKFWRAFIPLDSHHLDEDPDQH
jgi:hypothetical protein